MANGDRKAPPPRSGHVSVVIGKYLLVWGGYTDYVSTLIICYAWIWHFSVINKDCIAYSVSDIRCKHFKRKGLSVFNANFYTYIHNFITTKNYWRWLLFFFYNCPLRICVPQLTTIGRIHLYYMVYITYIPNDIKVLMHYPTQRNIQTCIIQNKTNDIYVK